MLITRELTENDVQVINSWRQNRELINNLGAPYRYICKEVDNTWFENYLKNRNNTVRIATVDSKNLEIPLCITTLANIDWVNRSCELHIMIGDKVNRNNGIGSHSIKQAIEHAFNDLNLNRIELEVLETNQNAIEFYKKHGFIQEGLKKQAAYKNGHYINVIGMALLKEQI